ncbi:MAG: hypothetical protein ACOZAA_18330 [Pseudomonadota bacterium]
MAIVKTLVSLAAGAGFLFAAAQAGDAAGRPDDYSVQAASYVKDRLEDARGARIQIVSEPYQVEADINGHSDLVGWGVDVRVRSRLPGGDYGNYVPYTVVFVNGEPVALCVDTSDLTRV